MVCPGEGQISCAVNMRMVSWPRRAGNPDTDIQILVLTEFKWVCPYSASALHPSGIYIIVLSPGHLPAPPYFPQAVEPFQRSSLQHLAQHTVLVAVSLHSSLLKWPWLTWSLIEHIQSEFMNRNGGYMIFFFYLKSPTPSYSVNGSPPANSLQSPQQFPHFLGLIFTG